MAGTCPGGSRFSRSAEFAAAWLMASSTIVPGTSIVRSRAFRSRQQFRFHFRKVFRSRRRRVRKGDSNPYSLSATGQDRRVCHRHSRARTNRSRLAHATAQPVAGRGLTFETTSSSTAPRRSGRELMARRAGNRQLWSPAAATSLLSSYRRLTDGATELLRRTRTPRPASVISACWRRS